MYVCRCLYMQQSVLKTGAPTPLVSKETLAQFRMILGPPLKQTSTTNISHQFVKPVLYGRGAQCKDIL